MFKPAFLDLQFPHFQITAVIALIPTQRLPVVILAAVCAMLILLQMAACGMNIITNPSPAMASMEGLRLSRQCAGGRILYFESDAHRIAARYGTARQFAFVLQSVLGDGVVPERTESRSV